MPQPIRVLCLADSHLGFDLPLQPRVARRRRGHDFLANHAAALAPALAGEVDLVVHAGDVFDRPDVPASLAYQAYRPLLAVAETGVPVFVVPGNHGRSRLPHAHLLRHSRVRVFDRAGVAVVVVRGARVVLAGFPYEWRGVRARFSELLAATGWSTEPADARLLCVHQCVEGATVGPGEHVFRDAADVIRARDLPTGFAAVLSGHIHRHQVLRRDLQGKVLTAPVLYPGSVERTSLAEAGEPKGYLLLELEPAADGGRVHWEFRPLPARPMVVQRVCAGQGARVLTAAVRALVAGAPADAVLRIRLDGAPTAEELRAVSSAALRAVVPETMNVEVRLETGRLFVARRSTARREGGSRPAQAALEL